MEETQNTPNWDVSIEVKIPPEWRNLGVVNIGITSGIETTKVIPSWNDFADKMDLIIVESTQAKTCFDKILIFSLFS